MTIDVEDYYQIIGVKGTPPLEMWDKLPSRIELGLNRYFELLAAKDIKATLFFLGYVGSKQPDLVRRAVACGHEIASHGMYHRKISGMKPEEFSQDARDSRHILQDISGQEVLGWRSPGFFIGKDTPWFFERLLAAGYQYDSSVLPFGKDRISMIDGALAPGFISCTGGRIFEFPITQVKVLGTRISVFGGGYLRFCPYWLLKLLTARVLTQYPLTIYIHPREIDPHHPRIEMNALRRFKSYVNLASVPAKLNMLLDATEFIRMGDYFARYQQR